MPEKFVVAVKAAGLSGPEVQSVLADTIWFTAVALEDKLEGAEKLVPKEGRARLVEMTREAMQAAVRLCLRPLTPTPFGRASKGVYVRGALEVPGGCPQHDAPCSFPVAQHRLDPT